VEPDPPATLPCGSTQKEEGEGGEGRGRPRNEMKPAPPKGVRVPIDNAAERKIESMMVSIDKLENDKLQRKGRKSLRLELWAVERLRRLEGRDEKGCPRLGRSIFLPLRSSTSLIELQDLVMHTFHESGIRRWPVSERERPSCFLCSSSLLSSLPFLKASKRSRL